MIGLFKSAFKTDAYEDLAPREFLAQAKATPDAVLVDVRTRGEFAMDKIQGAINIDFFNPRFAEELAKLDKDKPYFVYCRSGNRSANACRIMHRMGFEKLYNMPGGVISL